MRREKNKNIGGGLQPLTSLSKGLGLLLQLREASSPMTLSEISRRAGLHKVTTLRLLITLEKFHFVERNREEKTFEIGRNAFYVGNGFARKGPRQKILEVMTGLVRDCHHTVTLSVLDGASVLFVERLDGTERVKVTVDIGSRVPVYSSATGRALLAGLTDKQIIERFKGTRLGRFVDGTPATISKLLADVAKVRSRGFAVNDQQSAPGLVAIAVPVKNHRGEHVAALGMAFPAGSLKKDGQKRLTGILLDAAKEIESFGIEGWRTTL
ncbi:MAG TPA: IclR family transcriptional regulator [Candidatus Acidoferrales bacterium]|nr:IclR family transcriptional regulator [Candidatus Acidoferrales bacterium]